MKDLVIHSYIKFPVVNKSVIKINHLSGMMIMITGKLTD